LVGCSDPRTGTEVLHHGRGDGHVLRKHAPRVERVSRHGCGFPCRGRRGGGTGARPHSSEPRAEHGLVPVDDLGPGLVEQFLDCFLVDFEVSRTQHRHRADRRSATQDVHPCDQLGHGERFNQEVVRGP
jgi:hypothetical protein